MRDFNLMMGSMVFSEEEASASRRGPVSTVGGGQQDAPPAPSPHLLHSPPQARKREPPWHPSSDLGLSGSRLWENKCLFKPTQCLVFCSNGPRRLRQGWEVRLSGEGSTYFVLFPSLSYTTTFALWTFLTLASRGLDHKIPCSTVSLEKMCHF